MWPDIVITRDMSRRSISDIAWWWFSMFMRMSLELKSVWHDLSECIQFLCWRYRLVQTKVWLQMPYLCLYSWSTDGLCYHLMCQPSTYLGHEKMAPIWYALLGWGATSFDTPLMHLRAIWLAIPFLKDLLDNPFYFKVWLSYVKSLLFHLIS